MSKVKSVFIFGAGASADAGMPLMSGFIDKIRRVYRLYDSIQHVHNFRADFDKVMELTSNLQGIHSKAFLDLDNIETLFGALEMGEVFGKLGNYNKEQIINFKESLIRVIVKTIEFSTFLPFTGETPNHSKTFPYFTNILTRILVDPKISNYYDFSFLTFNYDVLLEHALERANIPYNYFTDDQETTGYPLLKLHGSINWTEEETTHKINITSLQNKNFDTEYGIFLPVGSEIIGISEVNKTVPFIVPPTWNKSHFHSKISQVWQKAAKELSEAENIFIIGYSLPPTDMFFRFLYGLGTLSKTNVNKVIVVNPDKNTEASFREMIGRGVLNRRFEFWNMNFSEALKGIEKELKNITN